jgi:hypothetical protein
LLLVFANFAWPAIDAKSALQDQRDVPPIEIECKIFLTRASVAEKYGWIRPPGEPNETKPSVLSSEEWEKTVKLLEKQDQICYVSRPEIYTGFGNPAEVSVGIEIPASAGGLPDNGASSHPIEASMKMKLTPEVGDDGIISLNITLEVKASHAWQAYDAGKTAPEKSKPKSLGWYETPLSFTIRTSTISSARIGETLILGGFPAGKDFAPPRWTANKEGSDLIFAAITPKLPQPERVNGSPVHVSSKILRVPRVVFIRAEGAR